jgi:hypothetical protein
VQDHRVKVGKVGAANRPRVGAVVAATGAVHRSQTLVRGTYVARVADHGSLPALVSGGAWSRCTLRGRDRVVKAVSDSVEKQLRSARRDPHAGGCSGYGDDPDVEPGKAAFRAFVDRAGLPALRWPDDEMALQGGLV